MTTRKKEFSFSLVVYRPNPDVAGGAKPLGIILEFTTPDFWVVGLAAVSAIGRDFMAGLDPLTRELLDDRSSILRSEIQQALTQAREPGDVLRLLARNNAWSIHVTEPRTLKVPPGDIKKDVTVEAMLEKFAITIYRAELAPSIPHHAPRHVVHHTIDMGYLDAPVGFGEHMPPIWMLPPVHWKVPID